MKSQKNKKILFYMTSLQMGGGERVMVDLMNRLSEKGFDVSLAVIKYDGIFKSKLSKDVTVFDFRQVSILFSFFKLLFLFWKLKPKVVFSSTFHLNPFIVLAAKINFRKVKTIIRVGNPLSLTFGKYKSFKDKYLIPLLTKITYKRADKVICVSRGIAEDMKRYLNCRGGNIEVIYSPKNYTQLKERGNEYVPAVFNKPNKTFLLFVGRLVEQKDPETLIKAVGFLKDQNIHLVIVGDGEKRQGLEALVEKLHVSDLISFEGAQQNPYVYMSNADIFILPSLWEGMPNVLLESLAFNLPIVASDCFPGSAREFLAPNTNISEQMSEGVEESPGGFLFPMGRSDLLAQAVLYALEKDWKNLKLAETLKIGNINGYDQMFEDLIN